MPVMRFLQTLLSIAHRVNFLIPGVLHLSGYQIKHNPGSDAVN
jgi:hypothetical protein